MSNSMNSPARRTARERPAGWPVGSFATYADAQRAVDELSDQKFPVDNLTIVGVDLMEVEKVTGRLTWGKVILGGIASGAWLGLFFGLLLSILGGDPLWLPVLWGIVVGAIFGVIFAAVSYGISGGARDFTSHTMIVAGRYDVLSHPEHAPEARDRIAAMPWAQGPQGTRVPQSQDSAGPTAE